MGEDMLQWKDAYEAGIFTEFMEQRGPGHTVGSAKLYEKGYLDYQLSSVVTARWVNQ